MPQSQVFGIAEFTIDKIGAVVGVNFGFQGMEKLQFFLDAARS